jgi:hypothetical protein
MSGDRNSPHFTVVCEHTRLKGCRQRVCNTDDSSDLTVAVDAWLPKCHNHVETGQRYLHAVARALYLRRARVASIMNLRWEDAGV